MIKVVTKTSKSGKKKIVTELGGGKTKTTVDQLILELADLLETVPKAIISSIDDDQELIDVLSILAQILGRTTMNVTDNVAALVKIRNSGEEREEDPVEYDPQIEDPEDELARKIMDKDAGEND